MAETETTTTATTETTKAAAPDYAKEIAELKSQNAALLERFDKMSPKPTDSPDLQAKAKAEREARDKSAADSKTLESALRFSLGAKEWLKTNASLLPKDVEGIFAAAEKENFTSAIEKDNSIKTHIIECFFGQQSNLDLLTPSQKSGLEEWRKLTKNGKEGTAQQTYDSIFEPTFEMLKRIKKAELLNKNGQVESTDVEKAYRDRLIKGSKKHYLGEKADA